MPKTQGLFPNNVSIVFSKLLFNQQQSTIHSVSFLVSPLTSLLLFFPTNISESQCFQTKHKTRRRKLKNLRLQRAREPQNGFHSPNFDRPSSQDFTVTQVDDADEENRTKPGFWDSHFGGLRPPGRPGPTAAVWLICVKMARSAPKPTPRKNSDVSRLPWTGGHCPPSPPRLSALKAFGLQEPLPTLFRERPPLRRNCK